MKESGVRKRGTKGMVLRRGIRVGGVEKKERKEKEKRGWG